MEGRRHCHFGARIFKHETGSQKRDHFSTIAMAAHDRFKSSKSDVNL